MEGMKQYCLRELGQPVPKDREKKQCHLAKCPKCFVYALVALWDKSGQGSLDAGDTPIFPGLTGRYTGERRKFLENGDVFVRLFQQLGQQQQQQQQQKENVDDQDRSIFRRLLIDDASTKEDFRRAVRSVLVPSTALPLPASPSSSPAHKKPKGSVECVVAGQVVVDLTGDDAPSGAQPVVAPNMAHARLSNTCPAVQGSVLSSVPEPVFDRTGSDDREASRSDRGSSRPVSGASAVQTEITKFFKRVQ